MTEKEKRAGVLAFIISGVIFITMIIPDPLAYILSFMAFMTGVYNFMSSKGSVDDD